jgi:predicted acylesterase/phospholipase RssA
VHLTSHKSPRGNTDLLNSVKIWEACRATSAATTFFDSIAVGPYREEFVDGGTGANNPIQHLWNEAQAVWGPDPLDDNIGCIVSIGTGVLQRSFRDDFWSITSTLKDIATETGETERVFRESKPYLINDGQYYRFNVINGLDGIELDESYRMNEIVAATRHYATDGEVSKQIDRCAAAIRNRDG